MRVAHEEPDRWLALARRRAAAGRAREAEAALMQGWAQAPTVASACLLIRLRRRLDGRAAALEFARQAAARFPRSSRLMTEQARLLEALGQWEEAARCWARVLAACPEDRRAWRGHLCARLRTLPAATAAQELGSLLRLPRLARDAHLHALFARLLERTGRQAEAVRAWRIAARLAPADAGIAAERVFALRRCGRRQEAFKGLLALVAAEPHRLPALSALVADARSLGRVATARRLLIGLARRDPELRHLWGWVRRLGPPPAGTPPASDRR